LDLSLFNAHNGVDFSEDSIVLLYRPDQYHDWKEVEGMNYSTLGSPTDGYARFETEGLKKGEYTFGFRKNIADVSEEMMQKQTIKIYPNPSTDQVTVNFEDIKGFKTIVVQDMEGKILDEIRTDKVEYTIHTRTFPQGSYNLVFIKNDKLIGAQKLIKQ
jgi:hypothetical protein